MVMGLRRSVRLVTTWLFRLGWNAAAATMTSPRKQQPSLLRVIAGVAAVAATGLTYWYWALDTMSLRDLLTSAQFGVLKVLAVVAAVVFASGLVSVFWPAARAAPDRLWLIRRLGGPAMAICTPVVILGGMQLTGYLIRLCGNSAPLMVVAMIPFVPLLAAFAHTCVLAVRYQFRLIEVHRDLAPACIAVAGIYALVEAIARTATSGFNDHLPIVVWPFVALVVPITTIALATGDILTARRAPAS